MVRKGTSLLGVLAKGVAKSAAYRDDNGMGLRANRQSGWSGLFANPIDEWRR